MNRTSLRARLTGLAVAGLTLAGLGTTVATRASATTPSGPVLAADDFASTTWADPWDFSNPQDILRDDRGPMNGISSATLSGGVMTLNVPGHGYISPLFTGFPGSVYQGRDGALLANSINAYHYTHISFQLYASAASTGGVFWFTCANQSSACMGGMPMYIGAGWHTYSFALRNDPRFNLPKAWSGTVHGLRIALNGRPTIFKLDWMRLWAPSPALKLSSSSVSWASTTPDTADPGRTQGVLSDGDASALPPGGYTINGSQSLTIASPPMPVVIHPDVSGGATWSAGNCLRWPFNSGTSIRKVANVGSASWSGGALNARNAGPVINDPQVWLRTPPLIGTQTYHRLTVTFRGDRPFNLADSPTGGTIGRVIWYDAKHGLGVPIQTADWVEYNDRPQMNLDLARGMSILETDAGNRYPWGTAPVVAMRWDPDEARGPVSWHLYDVSLCTDDITTTSHTYNITWHQATAGAVTLGWDTDNVRGGANVIVRFPNASAGQHSYTWNASALRGHRVWVAVNVDTGLASTTAYSTGPVYVR